MKRTHRIAFVALVSTLFLSGGALRTATPLLAASPLTAQQSDEAALQEAARLTDQAFELFQQDNYAEAEPLLQQALQILERILGDTHPDVATSLLNLAEVHEAQGNYAEAEILSRQALQIYEQTLGDTHPDVAASLNNLGLLYRNQGNYAEAEPLYQRALQIREQTLGADHPEVAVSLDNLADLYRIQGNYAEAEILFQRALQIFERSLGETHPNVAINLSNLALLYLEQRNYAEAEPLLQRALQILEQSLGNTHPLVATSLNNLAGLYQDQGNYTEAEPLLQRALQIHEQTLGVTHPSAATGLSNLAGLYYRQGNYAEAEDFYKRALQIFEQTFGNMHPNVATLLNNLAVTYADQGNYAEAESLYQRSLEIREQALGDTHPSVAVSLEKLAVLYQVQGNFERWLPLFSRQLHIQEINLDEILSVGSDTRKQIHADTLRGSTFIALSLAERSPESTELTHQALETILRRKGRVLDAVTDSTQRLRQNLSDQDKALFDQLQAQRAQLAALLFDNTGQMTSDGYRARVDDLKQQINQLENTLALQSAAFRVETEPVTIEAVQVLIPSHAALVELVQYDAYNFEDSTWQPRRYAAYVLSAQGEVQTIDLGEAAIIDAKVNELRQALRQPNSATQAIARQLDALLMEPIRAQLGEVEHLLISPDGQLNLIPFAALVDENNQYLVETYQITYLTSGRDLLRLQVSEPSQQPAVVIADPNYDQAEAAQTSEASTANAESNNQPDNQRSGDASNLNFRDLPGTAAEAAALADILPNRTLLVEGEATENALKQVQRPSILHVATHGFFLQNLPMASPPDLEAARNLEDSSRGGLGVIPSQGSPANPSAPQGPQENPLLRSGLALAGANQRQSGREDGILTALEASGLDLRGTQLVVLSACETGVGEVANGDGVYGLRRSLVIAGAESQMISLWLVDDIGTKDMMIDYYERLLAGQGRSEALRQVQLAMLASEEYQDPYYWAAFISAGNWSPLTLN